MFSTNKSKLAVQECSVSWNEALQTSPRYISLKCAIPAKGTEIVADV